MNYAVKFAYDVIDMQKEITFLRNEVEELKKYKEMYEKELNASLEHARYMAGSQLKMLLTPGVLDNLQEAIVNESIYEKRIKNNENHDCI